MSTMPIQKPGRSKQDYQTPPELLYAVKSRLGIGQFDIDLAASAENAVCPNFYDEDDDSLSDKCPWWFTSGRWAWLNPPFSDIEPWVMKAVSEAKKGANIVMLVPSSVGSNWWKEWVDRQAYISHLNGRLTFVGADGPYPKDCSLLLYTPWVFIGTETWTWKDRL